MTRVTREEWLQKAVSELRTGLFKRNGFKIPSINVSIGFPYASRGSKKIGECWYPAAADDEKFHIHISPIHGDPFKALDTLLHELVHVIAGQKAGHGPAFKKIANIIGLEGPMRSTPVQTPELKIEIAALVRSLGTYPHGKLNPTQGRKKQTTRMVKMHCEECNYIVRTSRQNILFYGPVICPCNYQPMIYDPKVDLELSSAAREDS
jgi:hypothetical protein